jgi:thioesterase domain-containing protein
MACQLRAAGHEVGSVSLLDSYPVGYERVSNSGHVIKRRAQHFRKRFNAHWQNIQSLPARDKLSYIFNKSKYGPVRIKSKLWRTIYRSYKNSGRDLPKALNDVEQFNWLAAQNYRPQTYDGRVTLFWASQDLRAKFDMLEGWRALARGGVELIEVAGTHLDIIKEPHVGDVAKKLNACLVTARS